MAPTAPIPEITDILRIMIEWAQLPNGFLYTAYPGFQTNHTYPEDLPVWNLD